MGTPSSKNSVIIRMSKEESAPKKKAHTPHNYAQHEIEKNAQIVSILLHPITSVVWPNKAFYCRDKSSSSDH